MADELPQVYGVDTGPLDELGEYKQRLAEEETDLGLQYVGKPEVGTNRKQRRELKRTIDRITRHPVAMKRLRHPLTETLTPAGSKRLKRRRAKNRVAKKSRRRNR